ncbi:DEAD/DEAH box helicase [Vibrio chagasii]|nr:DEAD/DEAH box helicase [Vibrio chagasii]
MARLSVRSKTGSGKTAAFGLGVLQSHLRVKRFRIQSLVLCPTRELADQMLKRDSHSCSWHSTILKC